MLKGFRLKAFQSHRDTNIALSRGITGIVGISNTGKTAILRGLVLLFKNRPAGFNYHSKFSKSKNTVVSGVMEDNTIITLTKGKGPPTYTMDLLNGKTSTFKKFGRNVPDLIKERFNIGDINIQSQMDPPFLITSPPGQIAETINKATKIEEVTGWIKKLNKKISRFKIILETIQETIDEHEKELETLEPLEYLGEKIRKLKRIERVIDRKNAELAEIVGLTAGIQATREAIDEATQQLKVKRKIKELEKIESKIFELQQEDDTIAEYQILKRDIRTAKLAHKGFEKDYIRAIKKSKKCPECFGPITAAVIKRIKSEISIA